MSIQDSQYPLSEHFAGLPVCPPIEVAPQTKSRPEYGQLIRVAGAAATVYALGTTLTGPTIDLVHNTYDRPPHLPGAVRALPNYGQRQCEPVTSYAVSRTGALYAVPQNEAIDNLSLGRENAGESRPETLKTDLELLQELVARDEFFQTEASKRGLTTVPASSYLAVLERDQQRVYPALPFEVYFTQAKAYMEQFGVTLKFATLLELAQAPQYQSATKYETVLAKQAMYNLIRAYSTLPKEYVALSNLETMSIVGTSFASEHRIASSEVTNHRANKTIFVNIEQVGGVPVREYRHEQWHLTDEVLCGGDAAAINDPDFEDLNEGQEYTDKPDAANTLEQLERRTVDLEAKASKGDYDRAEQAQINADAQDVIFYDWYAMTDRREDKAVTSMYIGDPAGTGKMLNDAWPKMKRKFIHQLARLWTYAPHIVEYFAATSYRS